MWTCLDERPAGEGEVAVLAARVEAAGAVLAALDRQLAGTALGSLEGAVAARRTLGEALGRVDPAQLREALAGTEELVAALTRFEAALRLARRLREA